MESTGNIAGSGNIDTGNTDIGNSSESSSHSYQRDRESSTSDEHTDTEESVPIRRSNRERKAPGSWWNAYTATVPTCYALLSGDIPLSYKEALRRPSADFWIEAINYEL